MTKQFKRICPQCNEEIICVSASAYYKARARKSTCKPCQIMNFNGTGNPFYGKKHTAEARKKQKIGALNRIRTETELEQAKTQLAKVTNTRYPYEIWLEKHGKDVADIKLKELKKKLSIASSGRNNAMYGKPPPRGSGGGWSGYYNGWFFRSLRELSFAVYLDKENIKWVSGEGDKWKIPYSLNEVDRNYFPDFVLEDGTVVECKPKNLWGTDMSKAKHEACELLGLKYNIIDPPILDLVKLELLINSNQLKFTNKTEEKFNKWKQRKNYTIVKGSPAQEKQLAQESFVLKCMLKTI